MYEDPELRELVDGLAWTELEAFDQNSYSVVLRGVRYGPRKGQHIDLGLLDFKNDMFRTKWVYTDMNALERNARMHEFSKQYDSLEKYLDHEPVMISGDAVSANVRDAPALQGEIYPRDLDSEIEARLEDFSEGLFNPDLISDYYDYIRKKTAI